MELGFTHLDSSTREWKRCKLTDEDLQALEKRLMENPEAGTTIAGTGGLRKVRFAPAGRGKSGGYRIEYVYFRIDEMILLATVYSKNDKANISAVDKAQYKIIVDAYRALFKTQ